MTIGYDVIVAGAGPAGSTAARVCAKNGLKTLLLDQSRLPSGKLCGGAVTDQALRLLDFKIDSTLVEKQCYGARVYFKGLKAEVKRQDRIAILTSREKFDYLLAQKAVEAGCELKDGECLVSVLVEKEQAVVKTDAAEYKAQIVIGADGVNSRVAKMIRGEYRMDEIGFAIQAEVAMTDEQVDAYIRDAIEIHFGFASVGYGWVFPKRSRLDVGMGGLYSEFKNPLEAFKGFLRSLGFDQNVKIRGHFLPWGGFVRKNHSKRILLAGDAAGFVDPFIFEGIQYAIASGKIAAECAENAFKTGDFSERMLAGYEKKTLDLFERNLQHALVLSKLAYRNQDLIIASIVREPKLLEKYLEVLAGKSSYKSYLLWLLPRLPICAIKNVLRQQ